MEVCSVRSKEPPSTAQRGTILSALNRISPPPHHQSLGGLNSELEKRALDEQTNALLERYESNKQASSSSFIPTFFKPKPRPNSLANLIKSQARSRREQVKAESVLDEAALRQLYYLLEEFAVADGDALKINYDGFSQVATRAREMLGSAVDAYFKASVFRRFAQDGDGCISVPSFAAYLGARSTMQTMQLQLMLFDTDSTGTLSEYQLEEYFRSLVPECPLLQEVEASFVLHYCQIAARKLLFFHGHNSSVRVRDLLVSPLLQELMELKNPVLLDAQPTVLMSNWFSLQSTRRVHNTFLALDEDMNSMLSRSEFSQISNGTMSSLFIQRIFEQHVMRQRNPLSKRSYRDEMDLIAFTDFVLAWDHRSHPAAIKYFFPIIDLEGKGSVGPAEVYTFFREIYDMWVKMGEYADLAIYDVVDELIDMVKPKHPPEITPEDLAACGMSGTFFSVLSDVKQFFDYNYRENFMHQDEES
mmetsp:Transcript_5397/g.14556  ORF Transcript_5397/g.14556 Transcript_5397/m.14556 type:complete len:474 (+) Transcript_5397:65-1486(+)